jgi:ribosomal protein L44E
MILYTQTTLALRCPTCGKMDFHRVSLFGLGKERRMEYGCSCGEREILVGKIPGGVWLQVNCLFCEDVHLVKMTSKDFWGRGATPVLCPNTGAEMAYLGPEAEVRKYLNNIGNNSEDLKPDSILNECFQNPEVMSRILTHLHVLAQEGKLVCPCGYKDMEVQVNEADVKVYCPRCKRYSKVPAATPDDVVYITSLPQINLQLSKESAKPLRKIKSFKGKDKQ